MSYPIECEGTTLRRKEINQSARLLADTIVELTKRLTYAEDRADMHARTVHAVEDQLKRRIEQLEKDLRLECHRSESLEQDIKDRGIIIEKHDANRKKLLLEIARLQKKLKRKQNNVWRKAK